MAKKNASPSGTPVASPMKPIGFVTTTIASVPVSKASFDKTRTDVELIGEVATTRGLRHQSRTEALKKWDKEDISTFVRIEGAEPGWGMTRL